MRILVADDEPDILESTEALLQVEGHDVETVDKASEIFARVEAMRPDVLLQDVNMPDLDLDALLERLRASESTKQLRILLFTAAPEATTRMGKPAQTDGIVRKPFDMVDIRSALAACMSDRV